MVIAGPCRLQWGKKPPSQQPNMELPVATTAVAEDDWA